MLISNISKFITNPIKGAIHIGAHHAEELFWYESNNIDNVVWIECNDQYKSIILNKIQKYPKHQLINKCISNKKEIKTFNISNNGQSSSFLDLGTHRYLHPEVHYVHSIEVPTYRMIDVINMHNININEYNFLNLDIQGYELEALKSFDDTIHKFEYIYTEVNTNYVYKNCAIITEIDEYLKKYGFYRKETKMYNEWGDALYLKS